MYWLEQNTSCKLNVLLVRSHVVRRIRITYPLIHKSRAIHAYCRKAEPLVLSTDNEPLLSVITDSFSSAFSFRQFFSDGQPSHNENSCGFLVVFGCLYLMFWSAEIETSWSMHVPQMHLTLPLSSMSATVSQLYTVSQADCSLFTCCHQVTPDVAKLLAIRSHCCQALPMQQFNGMSCDSRRYSSVFMTENSFSTSATYAAVSISASRHSFKNSIINRLSRWIMLCSLTLTSMSQMSLA